VSALDWRAEARRYALPVAFLVFVTAVVLVVRGALRHEPARPAASVSRHTVPSYPRALPAAGRYYAVQPGDTLGRIAGRFRTTVERLLALNPGVQPTALHAGQRLRVG